MMMGHGLFKEKVLPNNSASKPVFRKSSWDYSYEKVTRQKK